MTKNAIISLLILISSFRTVLSQAQVTVPDPNVPGGSIVEISTLDINGIPTVSILESIPPGGVATPVVATPPTSTSSPISSSTSALATPTPTPAPAAPAVPAGPVGAPPQATIPVGEGTTLFTYTTVVDGGTEILTGTFTPTYNTLPPPASPTTGTILGISQFHSQFASASSARSFQSQLTVSSFATIFTILCGITAGAFLTM